MKPSLPDIEAKDYAEPSQTRMLRLSDDVSDLQQSQSEVLHAL